MSLGARTFKKLASLSAIGAGAIAITADQAEAGTVTFTPVNEKVGFAPGDLSVATLSFSVFSGFPFAFRFRTNYGTFHNWAFRSIVASGTGYGGLRFAATKTSVSSFPGLKIVGPGKTWFQVASTTGYPHGILGGRSWKTSSGNTSHRPFGASPFTSQYALFQFGPSFDPLYGWMALSYSVSDAYGPACGPDPSCGDPNGLGPEVNIIGYAYDTSFNTIPAGTGTPEPDTFAATGLAALALGAVGMRRWRAARKA